MNLLVHAPLIGASFYFDVGILSYLMIASLLLQFAMICDKEARKYYYRDDTNHYGE